MKPYLMQYKFRNILSNPREKRTINRDNQMQLDKLFTKLLFQY